MSWLLLQLYLIPLSVNVFIICLYLEIYKYVYQLSAYHSADIAQFKSQAACEKCKVITIITISKV